MPANLQSFILEVLQQRLNDRADAKYWLPALLKNMDGDDGKPVLPLAAGDRDVGSLAAPDGQTIAVSVAGSWSLQNPGNAIPSPAEPLPSLAFQALTIGGLDNVIMDGSTSMPLADGNGYESQLALHFGGYPDLDALTIAGGFRFEQDLCLAAPGAPTTCMAAAFPVIGTGTFAVAVTACYLDVTLTVGVAGQGAARVPAVAASQLLVRGAQPGTDPGVTLTSLDVDSTHTWIEGAVKEALSQSQTVAALFAGLNAALNDPSTLGSVSGLLTSAFGNALDTFFGAPSAGLPADDAGQAAATSVDLYVFDRARVALADPTSRCFLPTVLLAADPLTVAAIDLGSTSVDNVQITLGLKNVNVQGLSNVQLQGPADAPLVTLAGGTITFHAQLPNDQPGYMRPAGVTPDLELSGELDVAINGVPMPSGTIKVTVAAVDDMTGVFTTSQPEPADPSTVALTFQQVAVTAAETTANIVITIQLATGFGSTINQILNQPQYFAAILDQLNQALGAPTTLAQLSTKATQAAQQALAQL